MMDDILFLSSLLMSEDKERSLPLEGSNRCTAPLGPFDACIPSSDIHIQPFPSFPLPSSKF